MERKRKVSNPAIVLKDCVKRESGDCRRHCSSEFPTPPPSTPSPTLVSSNRSSSEISWDPDQNYEVEKIIGYHREENGTMWYLIKWKGWSDKHNTFEKVENLTGCNYLLMKYFEMQRPKKADVKQKKLEIVKGLKNHQMYQRLKKNGFRAEDLREFSKRCLDISLLFDKGRLDSFASDIEKQYSYVVRCLIGMYSHSDPGLLLRAQNYQICLKLIALRRRQLSVNSRLEKVIKQIEKAPIYIENQVDLEIFPTDLEYVVHLKPSKDIMVQQDPLLGCECPKGCGPGTQCCGELAGSSFAYTSSGKLKYSYPVPIFECNSRCDCPATCPNRVVQKGRNIKLCIFRTESCGWGVKAAQNIQRGSFVCEYLGELIRDSEAVVREIEYCKSNSSYIFDLDFNEDERPALYCIDATKFGNVARFINHSCNPNLAVHPVWVNCLEPNLHRLAFFARKNIKENEEIRFDYEHATGVFAFENECENKMTSYRPRVISKVWCMCKARNCRKWVFGNK